MDQRAELERGWLSLDVPELHSAVSSLERVLAGGGFVLIMKRK